MGWCEGSELAQKVWDLFKNFIPENCKPDYANDLTDLFENYDCDTICECDFYQKYVENYDSLIEYENEINKSKAILIQSDDWEGLCVDGKLIKEGHSLGEGDRIKYFAKIAKQYNFDLEEMVEKYLEDDDIEATEMTGCFPEDIDEFIFCYTD